MQVLSRKREGEGELGESERKRERERERGADYFGVVQVLSRQGDYLGAASIVLIKVVLLYENHIAARLVRLS
jgi:hypothetical protein